MLLALQLDTSVYLSACTCNLFQGRNSPAARTFGTAPLLSLSPAIQFKMATRWGLCGAGKISHDFCVALKTLPPEHHQVLILNKLNHEQRYLKEQQRKECVSSFTPPNTHRQQPLHQGTWSAPKTSPRSMVFLQLMAAIRSWPTTQTLVRATSSPDTQAEKIPLKLWFEAKPVASVSRQTLCTWGCCTQSTGKSV